MPLLLLLPLLLCTSHDVAEQWQRLPSDSSYRKRNMFYGAFHCYCCYNRCPKDAEGGRGLVEGTTRGAG